MSSSLHPTSTPLRNTSRKFTSDHHTPPVSSQTDLQKSLSKEIHDHTWEFNAKRIAEMLSATGKGPTETLVDSAYRALQKASAPGWPEDRAERTWYPSIATFLNNCADACHGALATPRPTTAKDTRPRFYHSLKFIVYDRTTEDGVEGAAPVKPDLVGGLDLVSDERVAWSPQNSNTKQVLLPVEVKGDWAPMVAQAATYARCLFSASPSRQFALVLGFQHAKAELRLLVFHRGGLTGSEPLSVKVNHGQKDILRLFLSILDWRSAEEAGFSNFCNDFEMSLPRHKGDKIGVVARVVEVLHDGLCVQGRASRVLLMDYPTSEGKEPEHPLLTLGPTTRLQKRAQEEAQMKQGDAETQPHVTPARKPHHIYVKYSSLSEPSWSSDLETGTSDGHRPFVVVKHSWCEDRRQKVEADLLSKCKDDFGTPHHHYSFCPTDTRGEPMSTARFLPADNERLADFHWSITSASKVPSHSQRRYLWVHVSKLVGQSLVHAKTPWDQCIAIGHGMLGWLVLLRKGFLHRDISIGNVLMLDPPVTMDSFEAQTIDQLMAQLSLQYEGELARHAKSLENLINGMGSSDKCHGFVIDGDMAARLEGYFASRDTGERSGTYEFMSNRLVMTLRRSDPHLHSPIDDLESFYYTAQWAAAHNVGASGEKHQGNLIQDFRRMIACGERVQATTLVRDTLKPNKAGVAYGAFFARSLVLLTPWFERLAAMDRDWDSAMDEAAEFDDKSKEKHLGLNFLVYGYRGVAEYFELLHKHCESLQEIA